MTGKRTFQFPILRHGGITDAHSRTVAVMHRKCTFATSEKLAQDTLSDVNAEESLVNRNRRRNCIALLVGWNAF